VCYNKDTERRDIKMWTKERVCVEWDMCWFCDRCEKMIYWKTKGWTNPLKPFCRYCDDCKEKLEKAGIV
jgi:hypothetical protein